MNVSSLGMKAFLVGVLLVGACGGGSKPPPGKPCLVNSECASPLSCSYGTCHVTCVEARDCPTGQDCIAAAKGNVCQEPAEKHCDYHSDCPSPLYCALDRQCRSQCHHDIDCPTSTQKCVGPDMVCAEPADINQTTNLLKNAQSTPVPDQRPDGGVADGSSSDVAGSDGASGNVDASAGCDATLLADGTCDYCPAGACSNGTCVSSAHDYTCQCDTGYTLTGKSCLPTDSCKANNQCTPDYPCQNTAPPGQACMGQYPEWPVQETVPTAPSVSPTYANNGDGTITDGVTRLVWQATAAPAANCTAPSADGGTGAPRCIFADAQAYCASLGLAGRKDWRVPTMMELESLLDYSRQVAPYIAPTFLPLPADWFWTSSGNPERSGDRWVVFFSTGTVYSNAVDNNTPFLDPGSVRCVSGTGIGPSTPAGHYVIHTGVIDAGVADAALPGDTVTDNWTRLTWERGNSVAMSQQDAQSHCAALGGFRVPTLKELLSLVDPIYANPAIDAITFPGTPPNTFRSATLSIPGGQCSVVDFRAGGAPTFGDCAAASGPPVYVRCVR